MKKLKISGSVTLKMLRGIDGKNRTINVYSELLNLLAIPSNPRAGINYLEVSKRSKILDILYEGNEAKHEYVLLENADYDVICDCLRGYRFTIADPALDAWIKEILDAPEENPKSKG